MMMQPKRWFALVLFVLSLCAPVAAQQPSQQPQQPPRQTQDEFVPVNELPESEKLPAAPFLIAAYTIVWVVLLVYVWSLWSRLSTVERELKQAVNAAQR
jgi:CcmD family protein